MTTYASTQDEQVAAGERRSAMMTPLVAGLPWQQADKLRELVAALLAEGRVTMPELTELGEIWGGYSPDEVMSYDERVWYLARCLTEGDGYASPDSCPISWAKLMLANGLVTVDNRKWLWRLRGASVAIG